MTSSSRATCPNTEMRRRDRRWDSEVRPDRCSTSSFRTRSHHRIPSRCLRHFWWKESRFLTSADSNGSVSGSSGPPQIQDFLGPGDSVDPPSNGISISSSVYEQFTMCATHKPRLRATAASTCRAMLPQKLALNIINNNKVL